MVALDEEDGNERRCFLDDVPAGSVRDRGRSFHPWSDDHQGDIVALEVAYPPRTVLLRFSIFTMSRIFRHLEHGNSQGDAA